MGREKRNQGILQKASEHLFYEFWMFNSLAQAMAVGVFGQGPTNNAALESFTLHGRALLDFLYAEKPQSDDVIAEDFFADPDRWQTTRPHKTELLMTVHKRVGKEVAHLTYARIEISEDDKKWQFVQIVSDLNTVFNVFLNSIDEKFLGPSWAKLHTDDDSV